MDAVVLTCKLFVTCQIWGERLIELPSSWLTPNLPSGIYGFSISMWYSEYVGIL